MKKTAALILTAVMLFSAINAFAYGEVGGDFSDAVCVMDFLKVLDSGYAKQDSISRAEYVKALIRIRGIENAIDKNAVSGFRDVTSEEEAYIAAAKLLGFVTGESESEFSPDRAVTFNEAAKMITDVLGYTVHAQQKGGYPVGYIAAAGEKGLLKNTGTFNYEAPADPERIAQLLYNSLEVEMAEFLPFPGEGRYETTEKTLLGTMLKVNKTKGLVTANSLTSLDSVDTKAPKEAVRLETKDGIDDFYPEGQSSLPQMLGRNVTCYWCEDSESGRKTVLGYLANRSYDILRIDAADLEKADGGKISYNDGGKIKHIDLPLSARVIYNGKAVNDLSLLKPESGYIVLISTDGGDYDLAIVHSAQNFVVSGTDEQGKTVYFEQNPHGLRKLELDDLDYCEMTLGGNAADADDIEKGMVVSAEISADKKAAVMFLCTDTAEGIVTELYKDEHTDAVIDGETYRLAYDSTEKLELSDYGVFCLNVYGEIVRISDKSENTLSYAYLIEKAKASGISDIYNLKILNSKGGIEIVPLSGKVKADGRQAVSKAVYDGLSEGVLIKIGTNAAGKISRIENALDYTGDSDYCGYNEDFFSKDNVSDSMYFKRTSIPSFGGLYLVPEDTLVFYIPDDRESLEDYMVTDTKTLSSDVYYKVGLYDADSKKHVKAAVVYGIDIQESGEESLPWNSSVFLVEKLVSTLNADGEKKLCLKGMQDGEEKTIIPAKTNNTQFPELGDVLMEEPDKAGSRLFSQLKTGDIIQYKTNARGFVDSFRVLYEGNNTLNIKTLSGSRYQINLLAAVAAAEYADENTLLITTDDNSSNTVVTNRTFALPSQYNVYLYDKAKGEITTADISDIVTRQDAGGDADILFVRAYRDNVGDIVILK